jgi:hypothetical protein
VAPLSACENRLICHAVDDTLRFLGVTVVVMCLHGCDRPKPLLAGEFTSIAPDIMLTLEYETPSFASPHIAFPSTPDSSDSRDPTRRRLPSLHVR